MIFEGTLQIDHMYGIFLKFQMTFYLVSLLKVDLSLAGEDCQHAVTDEALCTVTGCALGTDVCHWMFKTKVNMVQGQEDEFNSS